MCHSICSLEELAYSHGEKKHIDEVLSFHFPQKLATLSTCITQFLLQGLNFIPFIYFRVTLYQEVYYFRMTMLHYALVESVLSPGILMLVMRYGGSIARTISRRFPQCS